MTETPQQEVGFRHEAFFYADRAEFLAGTVPFVEAGIEAGETVLIGLPATKRGFLQREIDPDSSKLHFISMEEAGRNPGRLISTWRELLHNQEDGAGVRSLGETIWPGRSSAEIDECQRHERLLNLAFGGGPAWTLICPYDAGALSDEILAAARHSHTEVSADGLLEGSLPPPHGASFGMDFSKADLRHVRQLVSERAGTAGLDVRRSEDLVLAACEIATNSIQHGGGRGTLRVWYEDGKLICDVRDAGRITSPLIGRERPPIDQPSGRGLWIANQLCDLVQIRSGDKGTQVRLQMGVVEP
ncbi:MAG: anti-sigma factor RsbA family regulatory protein [Solirubrobacterales bacterium]